MYIRYTQLSFIVTKLQAKHYYLLLVENAE